MLPIFIRSTTFLDHRDTSARGELAHRRRKIDVLIIHHESEDAAARATTETMKCLPARAHYERRRFLLMKRAERLKIRSCTFEREIRADYFNDIVRACDLLDCFQRNRSHARLIIFTSFDFGSDAKLTRCDVISNL